MQCGTASDRMQLSALVKKYVHLSTQANLHHLWVYDPKIIFHFHEDGSLETTRIEHNLFILPDQRVSQDRQLLVEGERWDRSDDTSAQLLSLFTRSESGFRPSEMVHDRVQVNAAITGDIGEAVARLLLPKADQHHNGFDRLLDSVAADLGDQFGAAFGLVFHHAIIGSLLIQQCT